MATTSACLACGRAVVWSVGRDRSRPGIPLDPVPTAAGDTILHGNGSAVIIPAEDVAPAIDAGFAVHERHELTCPEGEALRRIWAATAPDVEAMYRTDGGEGG